MTTRNKAPESLLKLYASLDREPAEKMLEYLDTARDWEIYEDCAEVIETKWPDLVGGTTSLDGGAGTK